MERKRVFIAKDPLNLKLGLVWFWTDWSFNKLLRRRFRMIYT